MDNNIDDIELDPTLPSLQSLRRSALAEQRRLRTKALERRRLERQTKLEERERIRRAKEDWAVADGLDGDKNRKKEGDSAPSSPDLMESPPSSLTPARMSTGKMSNCRRTMIKNQSGSDDDSPMKRMASKENSTPSIMRNGTYSPKIRSKISSRYPGSPVVEAVSSEMPQVKKPATNRFKKKWHVESSDSEEEIDFEQTLQRRRQETKQQRQHDDLSMSNPKSKVNTIAVTTVTFSPDATTRQKKSKFALESSSSSSSEDEAALEERLKRRYQERLKEKKNKSKPPSTDSKRTSSSSGSDHHLDNNIGAINNCHGEAVSSKPTSNPPLPSKQKRTLLIRNLSSSSSSEDEEQLELRFRKSLEEKRLALYKRNPLAMAKKDANEWKERCVNNSGVPRVHASGQVLVGKEFLLNGDRNSAVNENGDNASDLGRSEEKDWKRPSRSRLKKGKSSSSSDSSFGVVKKQDFAKSNDTEDDLWDDSEEEMKTVADSESDAGDKKTSRKTVKAHVDDAKPRKRSRSQPRKMEDTSKSPQPPKKRPSPAKKEDDLNASIARKPGSRGVDKTQEDSDASVTDDEEQLMSKQLKPNFDKPKLGPPGALVPFVLSRSYGNEDRKPSADELKNGRVMTLQVPASINRYLQEYQRTGIQFMFSSVIEGKGCVLGDDMGLGKTVQVISLIAALFDKSGTGLDKINIQRLRRKVAKAVDTAAKAELDKSLGISNDIDISRLYDHIERSDFAPILIVVPSSVIQNWVNEFETWGHFNVSVYAGSNREKALDEVFNGSSFILIAGKALFTRDSDFINFTKIEWKLVFVDEFHEFKNHKSRAFSCLKQLRDDSECPIVGMTGTLMQNNHDELFTLIDLVRPGLLEDRRSFLEYTSKPIKLARTKDAKDEMRRLGKQREEELLRTISPAYLERKKEVVLKDSLTRKNEKVIFCELSELQKKLYRHLLSLPDFYLLRMANAPCGACNINQQYFIGYKRMKTLKEQLNYQRRHKGELKPNKRCCFRFPYKGMGEQEVGDGIDPNAILWRQNHRAIITDPGAIPNGTEIVDGEYLSCKSCPMCISLAAMNKLYKVCSHPSLLQVDRTLPGPDAERKLEFAKVAFPPELLSELPGQDYYRSDGIMDDHLKLSGKMKTLDYCLRRFLKKRDRVLVFSYSTATLDLIQHHIKTQGWTYLRLDGQTPTSSRQSLVDQFQKDEGISLFLISTRAGGLGLNLTAANKVIIFDVNWNPSYDEQAQDRSYRIGQENNVEVVRLVARGTIEEQMYARQVYKVQLKKQTLGGNAEGKNQPHIFKGVDRDENRKGELFGLENLLKFRDGSFMQLLWKKSDNPNEAHDVSEITRFTEDDMNKAIEEEGMDEGCKKLLSMVAECGSKDEDDNERFEASGFNHEDLFHEERGRARIAQGDDEFEDEMGGESQMIHVATKLACENFESDTTDGDEDIVAVVAPPKKEPVLPYFEEERAGDLDVPSHSTINPVSAVAEGAKKYSTIYCRPVDDEQKQRSVFQQSPEGLDYDSMHNEKELASSLSAEDIPPRSNPTDIVNDQIHTSKPKSRSKVSIMGVVFEGSKASKGENKKSSLYIPSYQRAKKS